MNIVEYEAPMVPEMTSVYNEAVHDVPHCYPVSEERMAHAMWGVAECRRRHCQFRSEEVLVAVSGGSVTGFVHLAVARIREEESDQGVIRFLCYRRGSRKVGQALLAAAESSFARHALPRAAAFPHECTYPFYYLESAYLSEHLGHVHALLAFAGYRPTCGEVFLDWPDFEPLEPEPARAAADIAVEWREGRGSRPDLRVTAVKDGKEIGECKCASFAERTDAEEARDWFWTEWLGVAEEVRGKGLGGHLLRRALQEMYGAGYRHAAISTDWDNHRAFLFYSNFGYRVVDWTYGFGRELK